MEGDGYRQQVQLRFMKITPELTAIARHHATDGTGDAKQIADALLRAMACIDELAIQLDAHPDGHFLQSLKRVRPNRN